MKRLIVNICLVFVFYPAFAQKINIDSLTRVALSRDRNFQTIHSPNRDSLLNLFSSTKSITDRIHIIYDITYNYGILNPKQAYYFQNKILALSKKINDPVCEAIILSERGDNFFGNGNSADGLKILFNSLKLAEKTGNGQALGIVYNNLGFFYRNNANLGKLYYLKALQFSQASGDDLFVCFELRNLSDNYKKFHKADSAMFYLLKSFELSVNKNIMQAIPVNLVGLGKLQPDAAAGLKYYRAALNMPFTRHDSTMTSFVLTNIAYYYRDINNTDSSLFYAKKAYYTAGSLFLAKKITPAQLLAELYKKRNADSALKYQDIYYATRDSLYNVNKVVSEQYVAFADQQRQREMEAQKVAYQTTLRFYILILVIVFLLALAFVFWRNSISRQKDNLLLKDQKEQIQQTLQELKLTQQQLIQSEKMASLGELTAGIAHEIQNPLNFVNNFSQVNIELFDEMELELTKGDKDEAALIAIDIKQNLEKIQFHGKRADGIVKGMLQHSRTGGGTKEPTDLNKLADEFLRLAYHGLRAKDKTFNTDLETKFDNSLPLVNIIGQDIGRVLLNLFTNAFYALQQKQKMAGSDYKPMIKVTSQLSGNFVEVRVWDNGTGIPKALQEKIMQPFFTTKPTGEGTGLGLSLSYDIVAKAHNGRIEVASEEGVYSEFVLAIPI